MKTNRLTYLMIFALAMTFAATGCRKKPVDVTNLPGRTGNPKDPGQTGLQPVRPIGGEERPLGGGALPEDLSGNLEERFNLDRAQFAADMVHFEYDSAAIKSSEKPHVQAVANGMKAMSGVALLIEGHCDERGTEEYNRALGERRALALREALIDLGADGMKITTRSYGKDRKIDTGNSEASHAKNRRGEFVVLRPK
jgi:peptidoglycan-associated lipoprotein